MSGIYVDLAEWDRWEAEREARLRRERLSELEVQVFLVRECLAATLEMLGEAREEAHGLNLLLTAVLRERPG